MLQKAFQDANKSAYFVRHDGIPRRVFWEDSNAVSVHGIQLRGHLSTLLCDEACSPPIFNYSRIFSWSASVEQVADAFRGASGRSQNRVPVNPNMGWVDVKEGSDR